MVKGNDLVKSNFWTYLYLDYVIWTQMCVYLTISVIYVYQSFFLIKEYWSLSWKYVYLAYVCYPLVFAEFVCDELESAGKHSIFGDPSAKM